MKLHQIQSDEINLVTAYADDSVTVARVRHRRSVIITPEQIFGDWRPSSGDELTVADLRPLVDLAPEVVLLGTGVRLRFPDPQAVAPLRARSIGVEVMDTAAACRTYNIIAAEGRKVVAALIIERGD